MTANVGESIRRKLNCAKGSSLLSVRYAWERRFLFVETISEAQL